MLFARPDRALRLRLTALAAVGLVLFAACATWLGLSFVGVLGRDVPVTVEVTTYGDSLGVNSSVKYRGLRVGRVMRLEKSRGAARSYTIKAVLERQFADRVPASVVARVLPGSIFGADFVDLVDPGGAGRAVPAATGGRALRAGSVVRADTSAPTVRLMDTFSATQRVLGAIDPAVMDSALSQLAAALDGKGTEIRGFITRTSALLEQAGRAEPDFYADLALIGRNAGVLADLEPALAQTLRDSLPLARTLAEKAQNTQRLLGSSAGLAGSLTAFLHANGGALAALLDAVSPTYRAFVGGIVPFSKILGLAPQVMRNGANVVKGNALQMLAQFNVDLVNPYSAADCPRYGSLKGPNCR
ncbi:MAG: MCE family protein [Propionibacteriales bacterium]|nr:MCE family protein [Propionibacteriales bacterium]